MMKAYCYCIIILLCCIICCIFKVVAAFQLVLCGWAIYKTLWLRYAPDLDERWQPNEIENWFPPGKSLEGRDLTFVYSRPNFFCRSQSNLLYSFCYIALQQTQLLLTQKFM